VITRGDAYVEFSAAESTPSHILGPTTLPTDARSCVPTPTPVMSDRFLDQPQLRRLLLRSKVASDHDRS
jgi:hypothetical protein